MAIQPINLITDNKRFEKTFDAQSNLVLLRFCYNMIDDVMGQKWFEYFIKGDELTGLPTDPVLRRAAIRQILTREITRAYRWWQNNYIPAPVVTDPSGEL